MDSIRVGKAIEQFLDETPVAHLGLIDGDDPYVVPVLFLYRQGRFYIHSRRTGRKIDLLARTPRVCVTVSRMGRVVFSDNACRSSLHYHSVIARGRASFMDEGEEKRGILDDLSAKYAGKPLAPIAEAKEREVHIVCIAVEELTAKVRPKKVGFRVRGTGTKNRSL